MEDFTMFQSQSPPLVIPELTPAGKDHVQAYDALQALTLRLAIIKMEVEECGNCSIALLDQIESTQEVAQRVFDIVGRMSQRVMDMEGESYP